MRSKREEKSNHFKAEISFISGEAEDWNDWTVLFVRLILD